MSSTPSTHADAPPFDAAWFEQVTAGLDDKGVALLDEAVKWVRQPLRGIEASTGEPLDSHCASVAGILARMHTDAQTRASALLAVLPDDGESSGKHKSPMLKAFGPEISALVQGTRTLLRLGRIAGQSRDESADRQDQKEMQRKMLLAMAADLRIVLLRLASRLQSLRWYAESRTPCPAEFARETMELYAPLANRLGIWQLKWEMEDLSFRFLQPDTYKGIARQLEERRAERQTFITEVVEELRSMLADANIQAAVSGRPKHIFSIWNKMRIKSLPFDKLYDLRALRVIVDDERDCYAALALVHARWTPIADEFDDYISRPKPNGYRSLHTVVADERGRTFEIQIRTHEMHMFAEYGMAAHWRYKEAGAQGGTQQASGDYDRKISWMRQLLSWGGGDGSEAPPPADEPSISEHSDTVAEPRQSGRIGPERIYVLTPQARVIELPEGATPVDFAYYLHTDLGHRCRGARVDGQMTPLLTRLQTGQTVEIIAAKSGGPSRDWLNPQLGYLASPRSRAKVRAWFNAIELQERISNGQALVEKELQRLGKTAVNLEHLAEQLGFARADDLYVAVAKDEFSLRQIDHALKAPLSGADAEQRQVFVPSQARAPEAGGSGVLVMGVDSLLTQLARCCRPAPPDHIAGFVTRGRGVSVHRRDCPSFATLMARQPERIIEVDWGDTGETVYPVDIGIHAPQSANLLRDLSDVFGRLRLNVVGVNTHSRRSLAHMVFTVEVRNGEQTSRALAALNELPGVTAIRQ
ncbi:RelA/SpoT family protein [Pusillimonas sp.]|uniref:RelA/SpoT family protein n=1 Tax=Pusillimonas sp. TaxID=3040095 RepID=UPI0037C5001E